MFIHIKNSILFQVQCNVSHSSQATNFHINSMDVITIRLKFEYLKDFRARNVEDQENYFFQLFKIKGAILLLFRCRNVLKISLMII